MLFPLFFVLNGCMQQDSMEMEQSSDAGQYSHLDPSEGDEQDTLLEVSLTGSSRAERFLGSYDQISRLALDVVRNYGNKEVVTDLEMDNSTGIWTATVPRMIVGFDYTIRGHAYRPYDFSSDNWTTKFSEDKNPVVISSGQTCGQLGLNKMSSNECLIYSQDNGLSFGTATAGENNTPMSESGCLLWGDSAAEYIFNETIDLPCSSDNCVCVDGGDWIEIFRGETTLTVQEGTNSIDMRLAPILDNRTMKVPRITRIQRPYQLEVEDEGTIEVTLDTKGSGSEGDINFRFRAVDNNSLPVTDSANRGSFSNPEGVKTGVSESTPGDIITQYTAPDNTSACFNDGDVDGQCPQKLQIRVSNVQEIGVAAHFTVYVTDNETATTTIDNNPVITSISAERVDSDKLQISIDVSDDDLFSSLAVNWDYLFGQDRSFNDNVSNELTDHTGIMSTVMDYADSDDGMLLVTVCEMNDYTEANYPGCIFGDEAATSIQLELIPNAYP